MPRESDRDAIAVLRVEVADLANAFTQGDRTGARVALATVAQQVHTLQRTWDPQQDACPRITHHNGNLVARYAEDAQ